MDATEACLQFCEKNDVPICEILTEPPEITSTENKLRLVEMVSSYKIKKQVHGPYIDTNLASHNFWSARAAIETYTEIARLSKAIGALTYTIHLSSWGK